MRTGIIGKGITTNKRNHSSGLKEVSIYKGYVGGRRDINGVSYYKDNMLLNRNVISQVNGNGIQVVKK